MNESKQFDKNCPDTLYVWLVPSEQVLEQPGSWRIRKWDTEPFPEATHAVRSAERRSCPYCESDNPAFRDTYFDQTCEGCVKRMGSVARSSVAPLTGETPRTDSHADDLRGKGWNPEHLPVATTLAFARQLERELAEAMRLLATRVEASRLDEANAEIRRLNERSATASRDAERLSWLEQRRDGFANIDRITSVANRFNGRGSLREAIDAAMDSTARDK